MTIADFKALLIREFNGDVKLPDDKTLCDLSKQALCEIGNLCTPAYMLMHSNDTKDGDRILRTLGGVFHIRLPDGIDFSKPHFQVILDDELLEPLAFLMVFKMSKDENKKNEMYSRAKRALATYKNNQLDSDVYKDVLSSARYISSINLLGFFTKINLAINHFDKQIKTSQYYLGVENGCRCTST